MPSRFGALPAIAICLLFPVGCKKGGESGGTEYEKGDTVDLRALPPLGFKWTTRTTNTFNFTSGMPGGAKDYTTTRSEVTAVSEDTVTVKSTTETIARWWGSAYQHQDADVAKTRLTIITTDRCGRVLSSEGESRDSGSESPWPDRPLKIGESFTTKYEGSGTGAGNSATATYTLREVTTIKDRRVAVLRVTVSGDYRGSATEWRDLQTGITIESSSNITGSNPQGFGFEMESEGKITDSDW